MEVSKKALLASAVLALSTGAHAMQAMDDQSLSDTTGQQGLTITSHLNISGAKIVYTDCDGLTNAPASDATLYSKSGDLVVTGFGVVGTNVTTLDVGGTNTAATAVLNIGISGSSALTVNFSSVGVISTYYDSGNNPLGTTTGAMSNIITTSGLQTLTISSGYYIGVQLGAGANPFVALSGNLGTVQLGNTGIGALGTGGNGYTGSINAIEINDAADGGILGVAGVSASGLNLGTSASPTEVALCNGTATGLCTNAVTGGAAGVLVEVSPVGLTAVNLTMANITAGSTTSTSLGSLYISGMSFAGSTVMISGH